MRDEIAILDKSAFECLSRTEHTELFVRYMQNITPVLGMEILADLLKAHDLGRKPQEWVTALASKFGGSGDPVNMEFIHLVAGDLAGNVVPMTRQIIADNSSLKLDPSGEVAMMVDLGPFNHAFMRWAEGRFTIADFQLARWWRTQGPNLGQDALWETLRNRGVALSRPRGRVTDVIDPILDRADLQSIWLEYLLDQIGATEKFRPLVYDRWLTTEPKNLRSFAPYAYHCLRVVMAVMVLTKHRLVSQKTTNFIDAQYLYYLPFCDVFASGDRLHKRLVPEFLWAGQRFLGADDLKQELASAAAGRS